jgi:uncharacterized protein Yka (UPF0111/DUF47 family)
VALIDIILGPIESLFNRVFGGTVVGKLVAKIKDGVQHVLSIADRITQLASSVRGEVDAFRNWKEDFQIKNKVINLPKAVERTADLVTEVRTSWDDILQIVKDVSETIKGGGNPEQEAEEVAADLGDLSNIGESLLKKLPKLSKGFEKMLGVVSLIVDGLIQWSDIIDKLQTIVDTVRDLRLEIETGSTIFLFQGNKRRTVVLDDGTTMKIRVGNLHS